jgi:hypothetical protein
MRAEHAHLPGETGYSRYLKMELHATRRTRGAKCQTDLHPLPLGKFNEESGRILIARYG